MLVLSRRSQEAVVVGGAEGFEQLLKITVLEIKANRVRLGFEVAENIPVHRLEVWERIRANARLEAPMDGPGARGEVASPAPPPFPIWNQQKIVLFTA